MASAPLAAPIRQPRGPSANAFGSTPPPPSGPPLPDSDSLKRANTVSAPRHQVSASISTTAAGSSAFHGHKYPTAVNRFRSGSVSSSGSSTDNGGLVRKGSGRAMRTEEVVLESGEEGTIETNSAWGKGLVRQSSLPSRKGLNSVTTSPERPKVVTQPPPRPPRRISMSTSIDTPPPPNPPPSAHSASHSLSSLAILQPGNGLQLNGASVSRTQSLRAQAKHHDVSPLGRSSSMRTSGDYRPFQTMMPSVSPPTQPTTPRNPFTPPTPPPLSSTAALPPYTLPVDSATIDGVRRHQSLTQGAYGRPRDRFERSSGMLGMDHPSNGYRDESRTPRVAQDRIEPPMSPIGRSMWSPSQGGDDGWSRPTQQIQDAFDAMNLGKKMMEMPIQNQILSTTPHRANSEEPAWVSSLVGMPDRVSPRPTRSPNWQDRDPYRQRWPEQMPAGYMPPQALLGAGYPGQPSLRPPQYGGYVNPAFNPVYPSPPGTAPLPSSDADVMELARSKGLNPATYDCHPPQARFFVIKSYTEEDVQKSLKHEIWSSTVLGNKRLDAAFRESADKMPVYLFFSVNGSRHFCGVARMMTPVDENQSSSVWASDKWKGIFKVKWIFVRDVPSTALRHIRLLNTPEQKPITNSRDTQELHYEAGCEVLEIFLDYQTKSKTSLLQDFAYYEQLSANRNMPRMVPPASAPPIQSAFQMPNIAAPPVPTVPTRFR